MPVISSFNYKGTYPSQHPDTPDVMYKLLEQVRPNTILEIGTYHGGFTLIIHDHLQTLGLSAPIYTYDLRIGEHRDVLDERIAQGYPIYFSSENLFSSDYSSIVKVEEVSSIIKREGTTVVFCDGGKKIQEVKLLTPLLKKGDYILAHDYSKTQEYFDTYIKDIFWPSTEITGEQLQDTIQEYNLTPIMEEELQAIVWGCWKKTN